MYIDPGAGSIVIQAVSAVLIAGLASFGRIKRFFTEIRTRRRK